MTYTIFEIQVLPGCTIVPATWRIVHNPEHKSPPRGLVRKIRRACPELADARLHVRPAERDGVWSVHLAGQKDPIFELVAVMQAV